MSPTLKTAHLKKLAKVAVTIISVGLVIALCSQVDMAKVYETIKLLSTSQSLILYIVLATLSLIARAERYIIIKKTDLSEELLHTRLIVLAGTSMRNLSMSFIPFRLGELCIPFLLKITKPKELVSKNIHPIWISFFYDFSALLLLALGLGLAILLFEAHTLKMIGIEFGLIESAMVVFVFIILAALICYIPVIPKKLKNRISNRYLDHRVPLIKLSIHEIAEQVPEMDFARSLRILSLSILIRFSKYISLACLFYSINASIFPNFTNTLLIASSFIAAELFSSLPGSGVVGFGGYELIFTECIKIFKLDASNTINVVTAIHVLGFIVEIILAIIIIPTSLLAAKVYYFNKQ